MTNCQSSRQPIISLTTQIYLDVRARYGPNEEFEKIRAFGRLNGYRGVWTYEKFKSIKGFLIQNWLGSDPDTFIFCARQVTDKLANASLPNALCFDSIVVPVDEFLERNYQVRYYIEDVLPAGQICIAGGPEKGQKSNLLIDAAISLAAGKPWLGHFAVPHPCKVLYLTGETQGANLQNIMHRTMAARGVTVADLDRRLLLKEALPTFDDPKQLNILREIISHENVEVVIVDPLYFALGQVDSHLLTQVGPLVSKVGRMCIDAGATPIFLHHMSKTAQMRRSEEREPMQLADLNGAGFGPVAGSWILVCYLAPYDPDTGACLLWLSTGGRAGHGGLYAVQIEEGPFDRGLPLNGRCWNTDVRRGQAARESRQVGPKRRARSQENRAGRGSRRRRRKAHG